MAELFATDSAWKPVKIGGGGMSTGIDSNADGTIVCRTDGAGAYIWTGSVWQQLVTANSMPADLQQAEGVYEIRIAPSSSSTMYMEMAGGIYKTTDRGAHWTKTGFPEVFMDANGTSRADGQRMAIDPNDPNTVFAGTQKDGLWVTRDGGTTWQKVAGIPVLATNNDAGLSGITVHGNTVYVGTDGGGVYRSDDKGVTWTRTTGGPTDIAHAAVSPNGDLFVTDATDQSVWKYSNNVWTHTSVTQAHAIAIDPFNANHIVVSTAGGTLQQSTDGGATWQGWAWGTKLDGSGDVPWLGNSGAYMSTTAIMFDPLAPNKLYQSAGVGVWNTTLTPALGIDPTGNYVDTLWHSQTAGIENIVSNDIIAPAGGDPIFASWDRAFFTEHNLDDYATSYGGGSFSMGWSVDYASTTPSFVVGLSDWFGTENSGFSTDGGRTWQKFAGYPEWASSTVGGSIAASTPQNFIWVTTGGKPPAFTLDGGQTWTNVTIPGLTDWSGLDGAYYLKRTVITADRVQPNTFYLYDANSGVYSTHDGGVSWTKVYSGQPSAWSVWNSKIEAVPGSAGELFFTTGRLQGNGDIPFMHSNDGGASWQAVQGVTEVTSFGYGAPKVAGGPATVFIIGFVNMDYGVWYSTDDAKTWTKIGEHPMGNLDALTVINGDMDEFGKVYVGFGGNSYAYYNVNDAGTTTTVANPSPAAPTTQVAIMDITDDAKGIAMPTGSLTNDKTPLLHGTLTAALTSDQTVVVYRDGVKIGIATTSGTGWAFTDPGATDGSHNYTARVEATSGVSGNYSPPFNLRVDATAPTQTVATTSAVDDYGASTGTLASGAITDDHSPLIKGTLSAALGADESLVVYRDGVRLGTAVVSGSSWSFADSNVADGQHSYVARVEDAAGNQGTAAAAFSLQVKSSAPSETALIKLAVDDFGTMKGNLLSGATTDDTSPLLKGTLSASLNTGEQLVVYRDGVRLGAASVTGTDWSFADKGVSKGAHLYTSQVEDAAGQKSAPSAGFYLSISNQKGVKAAVMSSYSLSSTSTGASTSETSLTSSSGTFTKFSLAANDLLDTSSFSATKLTMASSTFETAFDMKSGSLSSLKLAAAALVDGSADGHGLVPSHASDDSGIDLVGSWNQHGVHHWIA